MNGIGMGADRNPSQWGSEDGARDRVLIVAGNGGAGAAIAAAAGLEKPARIAVGASSAREALREPWDLVIIDVGSREIDGAELLRAHARTGRNFLATGVALDVETAVEAIRLGAVDCAVTARLNRSVHRQLFPIAGRARVTGVTPIEPRHDDTDPDCLVHVSARREAASALSESQAALAEAHRIARLTQWKLEIGTDLVEVRESPGWRLGAGTMSAQQFLQQVVPDDRMRVAEALQQAIRGTRYNVEYRVSTPAGEAVVHAVGELRKNAVGYPIELVGTVQDVTELRATQEALFRTQREFKAIVDAAPDMIAKFDAGMKVGYLNAAYSAAYGLTPDSVRGESIEVPDSGRFISREVVESVRRVLASGEEELLETTIGEPPRLRHIQSRIVPQFDRFGSVEAVLSISRDVTTLKIALAERERLRHELDLLLQSTWEGIIATDLDGTINLANPAACTLLGLPIEEIVGRDAHDVLHHDCPSARRKKVCALKVAVTSAQPVRLHEETLCRNGAHPFAAQVAVSPILEKRSLRGLVISFSDMSEQRLLEAELERSDRLASLGRVAATMAHEFNNVLMGIQPFGEIIRRQSTNDACANAAAHIARSIERGRSITHQILRFTRPSEPHGRAVEAEPLLAGIEERLGALMPKSVELDISAEKDLVLLVDREQVEQAVTNLAINARDAMAGEGVLTIRFVRCLSGEIYSFGVVPTSDRFAHLTVADTGEGMSEDTLRQIFEPFFTTKKGGTGLGLPVVHQIVQNHGGHVFAEGTPGEGTVFHLFFPLAEPVEVDAEGPTTGGGSGIRGLAILLVEDDESVVEGLTALLENEGASVSSVRSGTEAIERVCELRPDALILDIGLPDISGIDVFEKIEEIRPGTPVVFSTGHGDETHVERIAGRETAAFLMKPYEIDVLLEALAAITRKRPGQGPPAG
jgi:two-component system, cell cycle sensor histidine kinase and response regulator CckA